MIPPEALHMMLHRTAMNAIKDDFTREEANALIDSAFNDYTRDRADIPAEPTWNGRLMVHLAALTAAVYRRLLAVRADEAEARRITARITWAVYRKMASLHGLLARASTRDPMGRLKRATSLLRRVPFSPPAYVMEDVDAGPDVVAFDVRRCPVAEYFASQGLSRLCVESWCDLDFPLARKWGGWLERTQTIAEGCDVCDFRWHTRAAPEQRPGKERRS